MRLALRLALAAAFCLAPAGIAVSSCTTGAFGQEACREIEWARCKVAPLCTPGFDVDGCERYYRDQCNNGIQSTSNTVDPNSLGPACAAAIAQVAACVDGGSSNALVCEQLIPDASCLEVDASANACNIILDCPEVLSACAFVGSFATVSDGGADADADADAGEDAAGEDAGDAGDGGDAG